VILFFWAHWCPDCKAEGPILAALYAKYQPQGLAIVAPTQRFGYVAGGAPASPDEELRYMREVRDKYVNTAQPPASTTVGVTALARPDALFEAEAIVMLAK